MFGGGFRVPAGSRPGGSGGGSTSTSATCSAAPATRAAACGDLFGGVFDRGGRHHGASRPRRGADVETETTLTFSDAIDGATVALRLTGEGPCPTCHGTGAKAGTVPRVCPVCHGTGQSEQEPGSFGISEPCQECRGRGLVVDDPCPSCSGSGRAMSSRTIQARIPAGVARRPADQDPGQGRARRARRPGGRPVRPGARQAAPGVRPVGRQPDRDRAGDVRRAGARRGDQGALAPRRAGDRADPAGHAERAVLPGPPARASAARTGRPAPARHRRGGGAAGPERQGAQSRIEDLREATAGADPREDSPLRERVRTAESRRRGRR